MQKRELNVWELKAKQDAAALMKQFGDLVNGCSGSAAVQGLLEGFVRQHRTLQQAIVSSFYDMLIEWRKGEESRYVDLRNQAAWNFAKSLDEMQHFPLI